MKNESEVVKNKKIQLFYEKDFYCKLLHPGFFSVGMDFMLEKIYQMSKCHHICRKNETWLPTAACWVTEIAEHVIRSLQRTHLSLISQFQMS